MHRFDHLIRRKLRAARRSLSSPDDIWERALPEEVAFWLGYLKTRGLDYPDEFRHRIDPNGQIQDQYVLEAIDRVGGQLIRLIDVGSGPLTSVGFIDPRDQNRRIEVTAIDPLADQYDELFARTGLTPPVRAIKCRGEDIAAKFPTGSFDIAYARNALDHAVDPLAAIQGMVGVLRPGGTVLLVHNRREGEAQNYEQLHQWNFDVQDDRLVLFNRHAWLDVGRYLPSGVVLEASALSGLRGSWVVAWISVTSQDTEPDPN